MTTNQARMYTVVVRGDNDEAFSKALVECVRRMLDGNTSGADSADDSAFYFESTSNVPAKKLPR